MRQPPIKCEHQLKENTSPYVEIFSTFGENEFTIYGEFSTCGEFSNFGVDTLLLKAVRESPYIVDANPYDLPVRLTENRPNLRPYGQSPFPYEFRHACMRMFCVFFP